MRTDDGVQLKSNYQQKCSIYNSNMKDSELIALKYKNIRIYYHEHIH